MRFARFMLLHTLEHRFHHNRSELARVLKMDESNFRRALRSDEGGSLHLLEDIVEMYARVNDSMSEVFVDFMASKDSRLRYAVKCRNSGLLRHAKLRLMDRSECVGHEKRQATFEKALRDMINNMEIVLCGKNADHFAACKAYEHCRKDAQSEEDLEYDYPCVLAEKLVESLRQYSQCPAKKHAENKLTGHVNFEDNM